MSSRPRPSKAPRAGAPCTASERRLAAPFAIWLAAVTAALSLSATARAEVPTAPDQHGREFRVDFSARHLDVDAELGELSLSGNVVVTVGRYRLFGERVRLKRGPRGVSVEGGGDIAFCRCQASPVTLGYRSVTIAPPSDVLIEHAVLRASGVPLFWLPYLWLRSPDRLGLMFPSAEWRGDDGLLVGSGIHVPFDSNQGRPAARALDIGVFGYLDGGARIDARLLTPQSTTFVRWDHLEGTALTIDAHAATSGESASVWAYDVDASRGSRGREALSSLEAAARRHDHARLGTASVGPTLFGIGLAADAVRGQWLSEPLSLGPFTQLATSGALGKSSSYAFDAGAGSWLQPGEPRVSGAEARGIERGSLESAIVVGPLLARAGAFEQGEWVAMRTQAASKLRAGGGLSPSLPLLRRTSSLTHVVAPQLTGRVERHYWDGEGANLVVATAGLDTALGTGPRGAAARARLGGGWAGPPERLEPVAEANLASDARLFGWRINGLAEPRARAAEATARVRFGARSGTTLTAFAEARTDDALSLAPLQAGGDVLPSYHELGAYDREGLSSGAELTLRLGSVLLLGGGFDADPLTEELLAVRSFARYRHACGCVALAAFGSLRSARGGFDAGLSLDLMP